MVLQQITNTKQNYFFLKNRKKNFGKKLGPLFSRQNLVNFFFEFIGFIKVVLVGAGIVFSKVLILSGMGPYSLVNLTFFFVGKKKIFLKIVALK